MIADAPGDRPPHQQCCEDTNRINNTSSPSASAAPPTAAPAPPANAANATITTVVLHIDEHPATDAISATANDVNSVAVEPPLRDESPPIAAAAAAAAATAMHEVVSNTGSFMCRICHNSDRPDRLISPCLCKGTLSYVHRHCLEYWLSRANILHCELCLHAYKTKTSLRYQFCESVRIWFRHPNNRGLLQSDLMVGTLLTIVTFGLVSMSLVGLQYFMLQGHRMGLPKGWTQGSLLTFLVVIIMAYIVNICLIARAQIGPWFRWWQSVRRVQVFLPRRLSAQRARDKPSTSDENTAMSSTA